MYTLQYGIIDKSSKPFVSKQCYMNFEMVKKFSAVTHASQKFTNSLPLEMSIRTVEDRELIYLTHIWLLAFLYIFSLDLIS